MTNIDLDFIKGLIAHGVAIVPLEGVTETLECTCGNKSKHAVGRHPIASLAPNGRLSAITSEKDVRIGSLRSDRNYGIAAEQSGLIIIDVDPRNGGDDSIDEWLTNADEATCEAFRDTLQVRTGGGGTHYYFRAPSLSESDSFPKELVRGVDIIHKGYVVGPGCLHHSGRTYEALDCDETVDDLLAQIKPLPRCIKPATIKHNHKDTERETIALLQTDVEDCLAALETIPSDDYHTWIRIGIVLSNYGDTGRDLWFAWGSKSAKFDAADAARKWRTFNGSDADLDYILNLAESDYGWDQTGYNEAKYCSDPVFKKYDPEDKAASLVGLGEETAKAAGYSQVDIARAQQALGEYTTTVKCGEHGAISSVCLAGIRPTNVKWLWQGYIPVGKIVLIGGPAKTGKSSIAMDIVARVTTGSNWPDGSENEAGNVVIYSSEDALNDTIVPRLMACGANLHRVFAPKKVKGKKGYADFSPSQHMKELIKLAEAHEARMVLIDNIADILPSGADGNSNSDVRPRMTELNVMADRLGISVIGIAHHGKGSTNKALQDRLMGSSAFCNVGRGQLMCFGRRPGDDPSRAMMPYGYNNCIPGKPAKYTLESATIEDVLDQDGKPITTSRVVWQEFLDMDGDTFASEWEKPLKNGDRQECDRMGRPKLEQNKRDAILQRIAKVRARSKGQPIKSTAFDAARAIEPPIADAPWNAIKREVTESKKRGGGEFYRFFNDEYTGGEHDGETIDWAALLRGDGDD